MDLANKRQADDAIPLWPRTRHTLGGLAEMATAVGADFIAREALELAERAAAEPFCVACVGQPGRGKSTLLNALLGTSILPVGMVPVSTIVTIFRYGSPREARVHFAEGERKQISLRTISDYVTQERNSANRKSVAGVEVFIPDPLLATGICLVHVPGVASLSGGNHALINKLVRHFDAAIVVLGADPPISSDELALIDEAASQVAHILFVLNKMDRLAERVSDGAVALTKRLLTRHFGRPVGPLFRISAYRWLNEINRSELSADERLLTATIAGLAKESGSRSMRAAERRAVTRLSAAILAEIDRVSDSLVRPVKESHRLVSRLHTTISDSERSLSDLACRFNEQRGRVSSRCAERRQRFLSHAIPQALDDLRSEIANSVECRGPALRARASALAEEIARRWLDRWLTEETPAAEAVSRQLTERFVKMANDFLEQLANSGDRALVAIPRFSSDEIPFAKRSPQYDGEHFALPKYRLLRRIRDLFWTRTQQLKATDRDAVRYFSTLLSTNASYIIDDLDQRVGDTARKLELLIRRHLRGVREATGSMLIRVEQKQKDGGEAIMQELLRLEAFRRELLTLQEDRSTTITRVTSR